MHVSQAYSVFIVCLLFVAVKFLNDICDWDIPSFELTALFLFCLGLIFMCQVKYYFNMNMNSIMKYQSKLTYEIFILSLVCRIHQSEERGIFVILTYILLVGYNIWIFSRGFRVQLKDFSLLGIQIV